MTWKGSEDQLIQRSVIPQSLQCSFDLKYLLYVLQLNFTPLFWPYCSSKQNEEHDPDKEGLSGNDLTAPLKVLALHKSSFEGGSAFVLNISTLCWSIEHRVGNWTEAHARIRALEMPKSPLFAGNPTWQHRPPFCFGESLFLLFACLWESCQLWPPRKAGPKTKREHLCRKQTR